MQDGAKAGVTCEPPSSGSRGGVSDEGCVEIREGQARILFPGKNQVFYNPVQEFNRDLSVAVIKQFSEQLWTRDRFRKIRGPQPKGRSNAGVHSPEEGKEDLDETATKLTALSESQDTSQQADSALVAMDTMESSPAPGTGSSETSEKSDSKTPSAGTTSDIPADSGPAVDRLGPGGGMVEGQEERIEGEGGEGREEEDGEEGKAKERSEEGDGRDMTVKSTRWRPPHVPGLRILEALSASGLRSIRYALEVPQVHSVLANDLSPEAYQSIVRNIEHNGVGDKVTPCCKEASMLMYEHRDPPVRRFDVVDIDPYGSPTQFLDSAVQSVTDGGLICVTCTDTSILCGNHPETCHSKYGSMSIKAKYCHEMSLRIVLACLESHANRYHRYIVPLLSCSADFYVRLFLRVFTSPAEVKRSSSKLAMVYHCIGCETFHMQPVGRRLEEGTSKKYPCSTGPPVGQLCDQCGSAFRFGGPIWSEAMHDYDFVRRLLEQVKSRPDQYNTSDRILGFLTVISEELHDVPLFYTIDQLCSTLHCNSPKMVAIRSAILDQGYRVSISHTSANAVKTDAPHHVVWDIMRCWVKQNPVRNLKPNSPAAKILSQEPKISASFTARKDANPPSRLLKLTRFPENPEANWGPRARAKRKADGSEDLTAKRHRLQGKRTQH